MNISRAVATMKARPDFIRKVGIVLIHNDLVCSSSRREDKQVAAIEVFPDQDRIEAIREDLLRRPGIFDIVVEAKSGRFQPGEDLLILIVAGDVRENVQPVLVELFDRIKAEAVSKMEITA